jgi:hypothetical protein
MSHDRDLAKLSLYTGGGEKETITNKAVVAKTNSSP